MTRKKKLFSGLFALALLATTVVGITESRKSEATMSDLIIVNVEALAQMENGSPCGGPKIYGDCESRNQVNCKDLSGCQ